MNFKTSLCITLAILSHAAHCASIDIEQLQTIVERRKDVQCTYLEERGAIKKRWDRAAAQGFNGPFINAPIHSFRKLTELMNEVTPQEYQDIFNRRLTRKQRCADCMPTNIHILELLFGCLPGAICLPSAASCIIPACAQGCMTSSATCIPVVAKTFVMHCRPTAMFCCAAATCLCCIGQCNDAIQEKACTETTQHDISHLMSMTEKTD